MSRSDFASWRFFGWTGALFLLATALASTVHPGRAGSDSSSIDDIPRQLAMDSGASAIFSRSCADCHSNNTVWPWYSYVPPASWLIKRDVREAQRHFNASRWSSYDVSKKREILADIARVVSNREMPVSQYLLLHRDARLSEQDADALLQWARAQRRSLAKASAVDLTGRTNGGSLP